MQVSCALCRVFRQNMERRIGLRGIKLVVSDAHEGIKAAMSKVLDATPQHCRVGSLKKLQSTDSVLVGATSLIGLETHLPEAVVKAITFTTGKYWTE
jgi:transposase-like protein